MGIDQIKIETTSAELSTRLNLVEVECWIGDYQPESIENNIAHLGNGSNCKNYPEGSSGLDYELSRDSWRLNDGYGGSFKLNHDDNLYSLIDDTEYYLSKYTATHVYVIIQLPAMINVNMIKEIIVHNRQDTDLSSRYINTKN